MVSRRGKSRGLLIMSAAIIAAALSTTACTPRAEDEGPARAKYKVGLVYLLKHPAIDEGIEGFKQEISSISRETNVDFDVKYSNAFGEVKNINTITRSFIENDSDVILALTTPCAQVAKSIVKDKPLVFVGVTDPIAAGLVSSLERGQGNITGTTSQAPNFAILQLALKIFPEIKKVGILYNSSEANSVSILKSLDAAIAQAQLPVELIKRSVINTTEILSAARALASQSDALFLINDNMVISSVELLIRVAREADIPVFSSDTDSVSKGAFFTIGLDYKDEGIAAAQIVKMLLIENKRPSEIPVYINTKSRLYINKQFLERHPLSRELLAGATIVG